MLPSDRTIRRTRRGLTLLETLLATAVLVVIVTAVMGAVHAGRALSMEARQHVTAALGAEMLMARVTSVDTESFASDLAWYAHFTNSVDSGGWNGHTELAGGVRAGGDTPLPDDYQDLTLQVSTTMAVQRIPAPIRAEISGVEVRVHASSESGNELIELVRFVPLPGDLTGGMP